MLQPYTLVLVRRMEVECGGECFTAAGIPCRRELWTLGVEKSLKRTKTRPFALAVGTKAETQIGIGSRAPLLKTAGCASRDKMVYWRCSSNMSGY
jgi:hypothetical protein